MWRGKLYFKWWRQDNFHFDRWLEGYQQGARRRTKERQSRFMLDSAWINKKNCLDSAAALNLVCTKCASNISALLLTTKGGWNHWHSQEAVDFDYPRKYGKKNRDNNGFMGREDEM